jgi:endogenous inhibitor of DNA gyrase (YacG/DUF329 family)
MRYLCPTCRKPVEKGGEKGKFFPFCSRRCSLIDLGAWLDGDYRIITKMEQLPADKKDSEK